MIQLKIDRAPELSGEIQVDPSGRATFPQIGAVTVGNLSSDSLQQQLGARYREYLRGATVTLTTTRRIDVAGAVQKPALYAVDPRMTVADVLTLAGGITPDAKVDAVHVVRDGRKVATSLSARTRIADSPVRSGDQLIVPTRSWVSLHGPAILGTILTTAAGVVVALISR